MRTNKERPKAMASFQLFLFFFNFKVIPLKRTVLSTFFSNLAQLAAIYRKMKTALK